MANRVVAPNLFASTAPNWSLSLLDANATNATGAINDSSLGSVNGPLTDTGTVNAYSVTCTYGIPSAYNNGMTVFFKPTTTNTGPSTLTVAPLSSLPITASDGTALAGGELAAGVAIRVVCDGTAFRIFSFQGPSQITSVRLRSFNAIGNPNFEVDQRNVGNQVNTGAGAFAQVIADRWVVYKAGTMVLSTQQAGPCTAVVPGTNFRISQNQFNLGLVTSQASLAAGDYLFLHQSIEGPNLRELINDVHSLQLLVWTDAATPLKFGVTLRDGAATPTRSLSKLCTITSSSAWNLIPLPNLPVWPSGVGGFSLAPGTVGYQLEICLACGSNNVSPANDIWQTGNFLGAVGQDNFAAQPTGKTFAVCLVKHEPGQATTLIDKPWTQNYQECLRYYAKSQAYTAKFPDGSMDENIGNLQGGSTIVLCSRAFPVPMAKAPTMLFTNNTTTTGLVYVNGFTASAGVSSSGATEKGLYNIALTAAQGAAGQTPIVSAGWQADTGW